MSSGGIFTLISNDGKQDSILMATTLLQQRLAEITAERKAANRVDPTPTLLDIERTHVLFMNAHFKPFAAIGFEYNKVTVASPTLGAELIFSIPQFGDFFCDMALNVRFNQLTYSPGNAAPNQDVFRYCDYPGERLLQRCKFEVNGNPLDEYTTEAYQYFRQTKVQPNKLEGYNRLVGQESPHEAHLEQRGLVQPSSRVALSVYDGYQTPRGTHPALDVMVPLLFWFNMDCRLAIPSVAIPYGQRFIKITLANSTDLVELVAPPGADNSDAGVLGNLTIAECTLYINNIFVNPEVHDIFIRRIGFTLIRVHKFHVQRLSNSTEDVLLQQLKWPIEYMTVGFRMLENIDTTAVVNNHQLYNRIGGIGTLQNWHRFRQVAFTHESIPGVASCAVDVTSNDEVAAFSGGRLSTGAFTSGVADGGGTAAAQLVIYENLPATTPAAQSMLAVARAAATAVAATSATVFSDVQAAGVSMREMGAHLAVADASGTAAAQLALYVALPQVSDSSQALVAYATAAAAVTGATSASVFNAVQRSGYNAHPTVSGQCARVEVRRHTQVVDRITITAHGIAIYNDMPAALFHSYQPFTFGGHNFKTPSDSGVHLITFALYPNSYQPSGHINLSRAREFYLRYTSSVISNAATCDLIVLGSAINFLLISDGSAVLRYTT